VCESAEFCDPVSDACEPDNGACGSCPSFRYPEGISVECKSSFCRLSQSSPTPRWIDELADRRVRVTAPEVGSVLVDTDPTFRWEEPNQSVLVYVFDEVPLSLEQARSDAVWAASVPAGGRTSIRWSEGFPVVDGEWLAATPEPPRDGIHHLWISAVRLNEVVATSEVITFATGDGFRWPVAGDPCGEDGVPGDCENPAVPQACWANHCRQLCASHRDCDSGFRCRDAVALSRDDALRYCTKLDDDPWTCRASNFGDRDDCDCGCGALDPDCRDETKRFCDTCACPGGRCNEDDATRCDGDAGTR
jgi:hypothetical protein